MFWVAGAAPKLYSNSSNGHRAIEPLSDVMSESVTVWSGRKRRTTNWVCAAFSLLLGAAGGLLCAKVRRTSRCDGSAGPFCRRLVTPSLKRSTPRLKFVWLGSVPWSVSWHVEMGKRIRSYVPMSKNVCRLDFTGIGNITLFTR